MSAIVMVSALDLQLISVPLASPGSPHVEQVMVGIKILLPKAGGEYKGAARWLGRALPGF